MEGRGEKGQEVKVQLGVGWSHKGSKGQIMSEKGFRG